MRLFYMQTAAFVRQGTSSSDSVNWVAGFGQLSDFSRNPSDLRWCRGPAEGIGFPSQPRSGTLDHAGLALGMSFVSEVRRISPGAGALSWALHRPDNGDSFRSVKQAGRDQSPQVLVLYRKYSGREGTVGMKECGSPECFDTALRLVA